MIIPHAGGNPALENNDQTLHAGYRAYQLRLHRTLVARRIKEGKDGVQWEECRDPRPTVLQDLTTMAHVPLRTLDGHQQLTDINIFHRDAVVWAHRELSQSLRSANEELQLELENKEQLVGDLIESSERKIVEIRRRIKKITDFRANHFDPCKTQIQRMLRNTNIDTSSFLKM
ncbi:hypothetical protein H0H93_007270 [Arthromyces matolae]|nr:hypothetical protein H0H93_007270 [Arthromyces matolae]